MALLVTGGFGTLGDGSIATLIATKGYGLGGSAISTFYIQSAVQAITKITVQFDSIPKTVSPLNGDDGLNPGNYSLIGPGPHTITITSVATVPGDSYSLTLTLSGPLSRGAWTINAVNIKTIADVALTVPCSTTFLVTAQVNANVIYPGSENDTPESIIRKHLNPALNGVGWNALISSLSTGDETIRTNIASSFDQLYKTSSVGKYLDRVTSNDGVVRPKNVGVSDDIYRELAIAITNNKVVDQAILAILQVFYGEDAVRAFAVTEKSEPYALYDGDTLNVTLDGNTKVTITFVASEFELIGAAAADEVAAAITRGFLQQGLTAFAVSFVDSIDGLKKVKLYSGSLGLKGSVQIKGSGGGKAQNALGFNKSLGSIVYTGTVTANNFQFDGPAGTGFDDASFL